MKIRTVKRHLQVQATTVATYVEKYSYIRERLNVDLVKKLKTLQIGPNHQFVGFDATFLFKKVSVN